MQSWETYTEYFWPCTISAKMPEGPEIKRYCALINKSCAHRRFTSILSNDPKNPISPSWASSGFMIHAEARGKELRLLLRKTDSPSGTVDLCVVFTHGLVGSWVYSTDEVKHARVSFVAADGSHLSFVDYQKMGKWTCYPQRAWGSDRGPDPVDDFEAFKANITANRTKRDFEAPICEVLLNQRYFNGIGNYLRAEILCRAGIPPMTRAFAVLDDPQQAEQLLLQCRAVPLEVLRLGLNKYGTPEEQEAFRKWLRCYDKAQKATDKGGRAVWFHPPAEMSKYVTHVTPEEALAPLVLDGYAPPGGSNPQPALAITSTPPAFASSNATTSSGNASGTSSTWLANLITSPSWKSSLLAEFSKPYWAQLEQHLDQEQRTGRKVFPPREHIFEALNRCPLEKVRVVILGQDPYHDDGQAHGLCFSVSDGIAVPASLRNIFTELLADGCIAAVPKSGNLSAWANQGVLLLNAALTVRAHEPNSHATFGWSTFTDRVIELVSGSLSNVVFLLWGAFAQQKGSRIDRSRHFVLTCGHPSPLSQKAFFGCKHFSQTNTYLRSHGKPEIVWDLARAAALPPPTTSASTQPPGQTETSAVVSLPVIEPGAAVGEHLRFFSVTAAPHLQRISFEELRLQHLNRLSSSAPFPRHASAVSSTAATPLGTLTVEQISAGLEILDSAHLVVAGAQPGDIVRISGEYYTCIPHVIGRSKTDMMASILDANAIDRERASLHAMLQAAPSPATSSTSAQPSGRTRTQFSTMGKLLLLISRLSREALISDSEKDTLKDLVIKKEKLVFYALEAFEADEEHDVREAADTLRRICKIQN